MSEVRHWIFLRGLVRGRGHWGDFPEQFKKNFPDDSIEMIDLPGNGERNKEESPLRLTEYVKRMRSHSQFIADGKKVHVLAVSLGAMIATEWMRLYPDDVVKAYLVCTSAGNLARFYERLMPHNYLKFLEVAKVWNAREYEEKILQIIANNRQRAEHLRPELERYSARYPITKKNFLRQIIAASRSHFPQEKPGNITLLGSYGDRLVSPQCTLKIARYWGLTPNMHPSAGHDIPIDDPQWLLEMLT